jgi:hypothetical protein
MSQLLIEYFLRSKIVFALVLDFYVYIQLDDDECRYIYETYTPSIIWIH